ncbi:unnamed protein product [Brassica rapa]|uniref:Uncharacterized protein n=2 Tax=Brassica TaxID=3705 RepID=A0A3P6BBK1_BRACM|nr:unnamed protein product [Brassica napus]CAG7897415.1 unnamed protein product [Brassica rapa]CDY41751.1 BnaA08g07060D [Brassica napus]VDD03467.1 unnamed protein product [Brassica rapa]
MRICLVLLKVMMKLPSLSFIRSLSFLLTSFDIRQCNFSMGFELAKTVKPGSNYILMVWKMYLTQQVLRTAKNIEETLRKKQ